MSWLKKAFDKFVDWMEEYNKYKTAAILSTHIRDKKELDQLLKDLYK